MPASRLRRTTRIVDRGVDLRKRPPRTLEQSRPGRCQLDAARRPHEQDQPELALQLADRARQRRLRHVQTLRRAAEVQLLRHGDEVPQLPQLNRDVHPLQPRSTFARRSLGGAAAAVLDDVVERAAETEREGAGQHGGLAERGHLDARRVGDPSLEAGADGLQEKVAVRTEPSAEDDERDVGDGGDGDDVERDPARDLVDDLACELRPPPVRRRRCRARRTAARSAVATPRSATSWAA